MHVSRSPFHRLDHVLAELQRRPMGPLHKPSEVSLTALEIHSSR